jgi:CRISPR-associated protein Cst2
MSLHVFANVVTPFGTAANNRAETEGNITTLQKLIWQGQPHSTVSAEAIRFALRLLLAGVDKTNRVWKEDARQHEWEDPKFASWAKGEAKFIDDDLLGFMAAEAAKEEGEAGSATVRRAVLEITRAISLTPWPGDVTFNAASPMATPSAAKRGETNPVPYGTEVHATRYQFGLALTPERLRDKSRAAKALNAIGSLRKVAGNHARFLYDFSPDSIVIRITDDPAPRILYCFETPDAGKTVQAPLLVQRLQAKDIGPDELTVGGAIATEGSDTLRLLKDQGVKNVHAGVKAAIAAACQAINAKLAIKG